MRPSPAIHAAPCCLSGATFPPAYSQIVPGTKGKDKKRKKKGTKENRCPRGRGYLPVMLPPSRAAVLCLLRKSAAASLLVDYGWKKRKTAGLKRGRRSPNTHDYNPHNPILVRILVGSRPATGNWQSVPGAQHSKKEWGEKEPDPPLRSSESYPQGAVLGGWLRGRHSCLLWKRPFPPPGVAMPRSTR